MGGPRQRGTPATSDSEAGQLFYTWHRTVDDPNEWVCVEGFRDQDAAVAHVSSAAFKNFVEVAPDLVSAQPKIINTTIDQDDWGPMGRDQAPRVLIHAGRAPPVAGVRSPGMTGIMGRVPSPDMRPRISSPARARRPAPGGALSTSAR